MPSARIQELERLHVPKYFTGDTGYVKPVYVSPERSRHYTESWKETEGEPLSLRRAKAFANHMDKMKISIRPHELIVGNYADDPHVMAISLEASDAAWAKELLKSDLIKPEDRPEWEVLVKYWEKRNLGTMIFAMLTEEEKTLALSARRYMECLSSQMTSRTMPDHEIYLKLGVNKVIERLLEKLDRLNKEKMVCADGKKGVEIALKMNDLKAMLISAQALVRWTNRYADLAEKMAASEADPLRKSELQQIALNCRQVPGNPAQTFWQALQSHWFCLIAYHVVEMLCHGVSMRLDEVFWPWYEKDVVKDKSLPREQALDLIEHFLLHVDELGRPLAQTFRKSMQGVNYIGVYTIGGVRPDGTDAATELTLCILDALDDLRPSHPDFKFRWHPRVNPRVWRRAVEVIRSGLGQPSVKNDTVIIEGLMDHYGFTLEEARSYAIVGCISPAPTLHWGRVRRDAGTIRPAKLLEVALFNGHDPVSTGSGALGEVGIKSGDATKFKTFDELFEAFRKQIAWATMTACRIKSIGEYCNNEMLKRPLASCFFWRSLESERDVMDTFEKGMPWFGVAGIVDATDSLIGLKKLVFDDKKYSMAQVLTALKANWEGYEAMRQDFLNAPKLGNDDEYADELVVSTYSMLAEEMNKVKELTGVSPMPSGLVITNMYQLAPMTGALTNGRKLGDPLADGGCSPYAGFDKNGPMAAVLSASKIDARKWKASVFNQKFTPASVAGESGLEKFQTYIEAALDLGLDMIQFNIIDAETLRDAQKNPEKHSHLNIRVSGYNARFIDLGKFVQDAIIERTQHSL